MQLQEDLYKEPTKVLKYTNSIKNINMQQLYTNCWSTIQTEIRSLLLGGVKINISKVKYSLSRLLVHLQDAKLKSDFVRILYEIFSEISTQKFSNQNSNYLLILNEFVEKLKQYVKVLQILFYPLFKYKTLQSQIYQVLCNQIINNHKFLEKTTKQFVKLVEMYRLGEQQDIMNIVENIKIIGLFASIEHEYLEKSKTFYINISQKMPKTIQIFHWTNSFIKREQKLYKVIQASQNTVYYAQKELIQQHYHGMLQYFDYMIENNLQELQLLWDFTLRLDAQQMVEKRLEEILSDCQKSISSGNIEKVYYLKQSILFLIEKYMKSNKKLQKVLFQSLQSILNLKQTLYNEFLIKRVFSMKNDIKLLTELFKLTPNKHEFLIKFQQEFAQSVLQNQEYVPQDFVYMMQEQCGGKLCQNLVKMVDDIWNGTEFKKYSYSVSNVQFHSKMLSVAWPTYNGISIALPDILNDIRMQFQASYQAQYSPTTKLNIKWLQQCGVITMKIHGIQCKVSQLQASLIVILDKSFRPMRPQQFAQVLQIPLINIQQVIKILLEEQIIISSQGNDAYELCDSYTKSGYNYKVSCSNFVHNQKNMVPARDYSIIIQGAIMRIMKHRKNMQKTDLSVMIQRIIKTFKPSIEQITDAIRSLNEKKQIIIDTKKGIIKYVQ